MWGLVHFYEKAVPGGGTSVDALMTMQGVHLYSIIDKLRYVAKQDILTEFEEKQYEEHTEEENEYYNKLYGEHVEQVINAYLNHLGSAYAVKKKTSEEKRNEICNVIKLVDKTRMYHTYSNPKVGCVTILLVMLDFWKDIDASIFLSVHGKYRPANALLRRWLETFITALYFDSELKKCDKDTELYKDIIKKRDKWLKKAPHRRFTGNECSVLSTLIDPDTDDRATQLMKKTTSFSHSSFRGYVESLYRNLSKHVHFGGLPSLEDELTRGFAEYDEKLFEEWYDRLNQINKMCNILTLLKFPEITGSDSAVDVVNAIRLFGNSREIDLHDKSSK